MVTSRSDIMIGVASDMTNLKNERTTYSTNKTSYLYYSNGGTMYFNGSSAGYAAGYNAGDEFGLLLDMFKGELIFYVNGDNRGTFSNQEMTTKNMFFTINFYETN